MVSRIDDDLDFALLAWQDAGRWRVEQLPMRAASSLDGLRKAVNAQPVESNPVAMVSVDEDFFVIVRATSRGEEYLLSDASAAQDWSIAEEVLNAVGASMPSRDDEVVVAGAANMFADFGLTAHDIQEMCQEVDLYPDEMLATIATSLGFAGQFDAMLEQLPD